VKEYPGMSRKEGPEVPITKHTELQQSVVTDKIARYGNNNIHETTREARLRYANASEKR